MLRTVMVSSILAAVLIVSGCGAVERTTQSGVIQPGATAPAAKPDQATPSGTNESKSSDATDKAQAARAKASKPTFPEIEFEPVMWIGGSPTGPVGSGVWVYTKAEHPGNIASINWDIKDLVLVQLPEERYPGYKLDVIALQPIAPDAVRIVCRMTSPRPDSAEDKLRHPSRYAAVSAKALAGKRFIVVDESFQELPTE